MRPRGLGITAPIALDFQEKSWLPNWVVKDQGEEEWD